MRWMVTGGCGFIGSHFIRQILGQGQDEAVINIDALRYAGNLENVADLAADSRHVFYEADIADAPTMDRLVDDFRPEVLVNFAAESHVDRSIRDAAPFLRTNVVGTHVLLEAWRRHSGRRFVQVSTDEVYGSVEPPGRNREETPLQPGSPYAASKAAADLLALSYHRTWGLDVVVTRCGNNLGSFQFPEKLLPRLILHALAGEPLPLYGDGQNIREWIAVEDHVKALYLASTQGRSGRVYNLGSGEEHTNLDMARRILEMLDRPTRQICFVPDRPGHDRRYALDSQRARLELGWKPRVTFDEAMDRTVSWYLAHPAWWKPLLARIPDLAPAVRCRLAPDT